jgi:hypothetical protein
VDYERGSLDDHVREGGEQDELGFRAVKGLSLEKDCREKLQRNAHTMIETRYTRIGYVIAISQLHHSRPL